MGHPCDHGCGAAEDDALGRVRAARGDDPAAFHLCAGLVGRPRVAVTAAARGQVAPATRSRPAEHAGRRDRARRARRGTLPRVVVSGAHEAFDAICDVLRSAWPPSTVVMPGAGTIRSGSPGFNDVLEDVFCRRASVDRRLGRSAVSRRGGDCGAGARPGPDPERGTRWHASDGRPDGARPTRDATSRGAAHPQRRPLGGHRGGLGVRERRRGRRRRGRPGRSRRRGTSAPRGGRSATRADRVVRRVGDGRLGRALASREGRTASTAPSSSRRGSSGWRRRRPTSSITRPTTFIEAEGTSLKAALDIARKYGVLKDGLLPFATGALYPGAAKALYAIAAQLKILAYFNLGTNLSTGGRWLATKGPILTRLDVDDTWQNATATKGLLDGVPRRDGRRRPRRRARRLPARPLHRAEQLGHAAGATRASRTPRSPMRRRPSRRRTASRSSADASRRGVTRVSPWTLARRDVATRCAGGARGAGRGCAAARARTASRSRARRRCRRRRATATSPIAPTASVSQRCHSPPSRKGMNRVASAAAASVPHHAHIVTRGPPLREAAPQEAVVQVRLVGPSAARRA